MITRIGMRSGSLAGEERAAVLGFFDGVHTGHRYLIDELLRVAGQRGLRTMVITYRESPRKLFQPKWRPELLLPYDEKVRLLEEAGVDDVGVLDFTIEMARLSAYEFIRLLRDGVGVRLLLLGYDTRFGRDRRETADQYVEYGRELGVEVLTGDALLRQGGAVSSSAVRQAVRSGEMETARQMLGRSYSLFGSVVQGRQIGRRIGFPTANLALREQCQLLPPAGVYLSQIVIEGHDKPLGAMTNIGTNPTFSGSGADGSGSAAVSIETHVIDFAGDLYGKRVELRLLRFMRAERKFADAEALSAALREDLRLARESHAGEKSTFGAK